jgi:hypothetical protein
MQPKMEMEHERLAKMFVDAANRRAAERKVRFGAGADQEIRQLADAGARRVFAETDDDEARESATRRGLTSFASLVDEMVAASGRIEGYRGLHPGTVGEQTLQAALKSLCPLFPIC